jgi:hypothetical protein
MNWGALLAKFVKLKAKATPRRPAGPPAAPTADLAAIYRQAGIAPAALSGEQALSILSSLPAELSEEAKRRLARQTLAAITQNLGTSTVAVAQDAARKTDALKAAVDELEKRGAADAAAKDAQIRALEQQREAIASAAEKARKQERQLQDKFRIEIERLETLSRLLGPNAG